MSKLEKCNVLDILDSQGKSIIYPTIISDNFDLLKYLIKNNIEYNHQHTFVDCINPKTSKKLPKYGSSFSCKTLGLYKSIIWFARSSKNVNPEATDKFNLFKTSDVIDGRLNEFDKRIIHKILYS